MKKVFLLLAMVGMFTATMAQDEKHSVATNSFFGNWFVQAGATWSAWYGVGERSLVAPFHKFPSGEGYTGLGASFAIGKWFTPGIGLRTKVNAWREGSKVNGIKPDNYWTANEQVMLNLSNLLMGYSETRLWNVIPYVGAGVNRNMTRKNYHTALSLGLLNTLKLSNRLLANVELGWNSYEGCGGLALKNRRQQFSVEVGLTYRIGRTGWKKAPDVDAINALHQGELDAVQAMADDAHAEIDDLRQQVEDLKKQQYTPPVYKTNATETKTENRVVMPPVSVFFNLGKAVVMGARDKENVASIAKVAKENNLNLIVTGYADSKTGTAANNQRLSEQRAEAVASELVRLGVSRDKIEVRGAGGVNTLSTTENNRRAVIEVKN